MVSVATSRKMADRAAFIERFKRLRDRSRRLFDLLTADAYYAQPIATRHPVVFYEGHLAAFSLNTLVKRALGQPGIDADLERLFARGIDPTGEDDALRAQPAQWPSRSQVRAFVEAAEQRVLEALSEAAIDQPCHPLLDGAQAVYTILEHEAMHQETLLYLWHQLPFAQKRPCVDRPPDVGGSPPPQERIWVPAGRATIGAVRGTIPFGWDNEFEAMSVDVAAFAIDRYDITNAAFLEFVEARGYADPRWWTPEAFAWVRAQEMDSPRFWVYEDGRWWWRGMFARTPLPAAWPVYVSHSEAAAYARWRGERLPTEAELVRAAYGEPSGGERTFPWGDAPPRASHGNFDFVRRDPQPVGQCPAGRSAWGVDDLVGNGWEWTSTVFAPLPGFTPLPSYPEYSADFFDGQHFILRGASPATDAQLIRRSFRNWFRPEYPFVYATFRCVAGAVS